MATSLYKQLSYDFEKDFVPITVLASVPNILVVNPSVPAKSVQELIAYAKANPGKLAYGSAGNGSTEHLSAELFKSMTGVDMVHIPYKGGAPMMADLLGGQIQLAIETSGSAAPHIKAGKVRALAVTTAARSPAFPELPTFAESGLKGYEVTTWYAILAPKGTPSEITTKLYNAILKILKTPDMQERLGTRWLYARAIRRLHQVGNGKVGQGGQGVKGDGRLSRARALPGSNDKRSGDGCFTDVRRPDIGRGQRRAVRRDNGRASG